LSSQSILNLVTLGEVANMLLSNCKKNTNKWF
jgi:hypothetical protein